MAKKQNEVANCDDCTGVQNVRLTVDREGDTSYLCGPCRYSAAARDRDADWLFIAANKWVIRNEHADISERVDLEEFL